MRQNSGQLLARYESYALRWNKEEALRLALWAHGTRNEQAMERRNQGVTVPLSLEEVGLTFEEAGFLVDSGVLARDKEGRYGWRKSTGTGSASAACAEPACCGGDRLDQLVMA